MQYLIGYLFIILSIHATANDHALISPLKQGADSFNIQLKSGSPAENIDIYYYLPKHFNEDTSVIIVIPGAGRNADDYRDSWIQHAEKYNLLVLSPAYPKEFYDFAAYHLGGIVDQLELKNPTIERMHGRITKYRMNDEDIVFSYVNDTSKWLFKDFDSIFNRVKPFLGPKQTHYDLFGHSAGGQILHRHAIFQAHSMANRIVAANSGFYTLPDSSTPYPFGTQGTPLLKGDLHNAFAKHLIVLLGENDNQHETRGTMLHTPNSDAQGLGRHERGTYFYNASKHLATSTAAVFNWQKITIKNVGHDYKKMGNAAAKLLYSKQQ